MATPTKLTPQSLIEFLSHLDSKGIPKDAPILLEAIDRSGRTTKFDSFFAGGSFDVLAESPAVEIRIVESD